MVKNLAQACIRKLRVIADERLIDIIAHQPVDIAKQAYMYAMMKQYRLVWDYMISVIGNKYSSRDMTYGQIDLNVFFMQLQEQDDAVASWSDATIKKIKQVLNRILMSEHYVSVPE